MNTSTPTKSREFYAARVMLIGMLIGLACMVALFIAGFIQGSAGMVVMASGTAAVLGASCSATTAAARKKAATTF